MLTPQTSVIINRIKAERVGHRSVDLKQMLGARIKDIRSKKRITKEQLSERMGINKVHKIFLYFLYPEHPVNHVRNGIFYAVMSIKRIIFTK